MTGTIAVGTSGFSYDDWAGAFYPEGLARSRWFEHYVTRFPTVELNATFYRLPAETAVRRWRELAPEGFRFVVKGSRVITHVRRLEDCEEELARFVERVRGLGSTLRVILWQLPPSLRLDVPLLERFLALAAREAGEVRHAVEFRHPSWLVEEAFEALRRRGVAHVAVSSTRMPADRTVTTDLVYARFHGLGGGYAHDYSAEELAPWVAFLREAHARGLEGYAFFNNDARARAPKNAAELIAALGDAAVPWPPGR
ncbi:MAG: hypothetical protein KatS3mg014_1997 [Actinomycetota bacterium]|nr:MAG: hypothetical protein KatS3mg014_1997 [Actinomycetota bacterium]